MLNIHPHLIFCVATLWQTICSLKQFINRCSLCPGQSVKVFGNIFRSCAAQSVGLLLEGAASLLEEVVHDAGGEAVLLTRRTGLPQAQPSHLADFEARLHLCSV